MSYFMTVTIVIAVCIGIILSAMTFGVMLLAKDRLRPFARSSYIFLGACGGVAYSILAIVWILAAVVCTVASEPDSAVGAFVCAIVGGVLGGYLLRLAWRGLSLPNRQNVAARTAWLATLDIALSEEGLPAALSQFREETKSPLLSRAVEELFILDNIHPEKWLGNWIAFNHVNEFALYLRGVKSGLSDFSNVTLSARKLLERWWVLPARGTWFLAAYPDVDLWWDTAMKDAIRTKHRGEGDAVTSLEDKVLGALKESDLEKADENTKNLLFSRLLVNYYRRNVNPRLECQSG